jgi:copper oxidase (laccase) domain-containing protein
MRRIAEIRNAIGVGDWPLFTAQQIHGNKIAVVDNVSRRPGGRKFSGCDGIITNQRGIVLGVYVADCCAVYIVDAKTPRSVWFIPAQRHGARRRPERNYANE